jgi:hypothetical protein
VPVSRWREDLLKMKAGGLSIVSAYLMWLHTEEVRGVQDFSGNRNVSLFLDTALDVGLMVALRIGPWDHGECRNGGLPDWVVASCTGTCRLRENETEFMTMVESWYGGLARHVVGRGWAEGGPVISIQVDNETPNVSYLLALKDMAVALGMRPAFWVKTGWPSPSTPVAYGSLVPLFGGYVDDFCSYIRRCPLSKTRTPKVTPLPTRPAQTGGSPTDVDYGNFMFSDAPNPAPLPPAATSDSEPYPWLMVEMGGGMASSYHRRVHVNGDDHTAQAAVFLGSGAANLGFYMYHGGTDPMGSLSTMQESQITGYPNDMPTRTYDFHAPLGEAGQPRPHYHGIRGLSALLAAFGSWLAPLPSFKPAQRPVGPTDTATLRVAVRSDGEAGIAFINNRNVHVNMSDQAGVRLTLLPPAGGGAPLSIPLPASPAPTLPAGAWAAWPFNLPLFSTALLTYALATPFTLLPGGGGGGAPPPTAVFTAVASVPAEFAFNATSAAGGRPLRFSQCSGACSAEGGLLLARGVPPGLGAALTLSFADGAGGEALRVLLLDAPTAARAWPTQLAGAPTLLLSDANTSFLLSAGTGGLELHTEGLGGEVALWALPAPASLAGPGGAPLAPTPDGLFARYAFPAPPPALRVTATPLAPGGPARVIPRGPKGNAWAPSADGALGEFADAAVWALAVEGAIGDGVDVRLRVTYNGDCARLYEGARVDRMGLLMDHFFNGHPMELPLTRAGFNASSAFTLRVLPLAKNAAPGEPFPWGPVGFEVPPAFNSSGVALGLLRVEAVHTWKTTLVATPNQ